MGILRPLRCTPLIFASKKKSTNSKPCGLPSVALAKDGGAGVRRFAPKIACEAPPQVVFFTKKMRQEQ